MLKIVRSFSAIINLNCLVNLEQNDTNRQIKNNSCVGEISVQTVHPKGSNLCILKLNKKLFYLSRISL